MHRAMPRHYTDNEVVWLPKPFRKRYKVDKLVSKFSVDRGPWTVDRGPWAILNF